jgi:hypothetical protein
MEGSARVVRLSLNTESKDARHIIVESYMGQIFNVMLILIFTVGIALLISILAYLFDQLMSAYSLRFLSNLFVDASPLVLG